MIFKETKKVSKTYKILSLKIWQSDFKSEQIHAHTSENIARWFLVRMFPSRIYQNTTKGKRKRNEKPS